MDKADMLKKKVLELLSSGVRVVFKSDYASGKTDYTIGKLGLKNHYRIRGWDVYYEDVDVGAVDDADSAIESALARLVADQEKAVKERMLKEFFNS